MEILGVLVSLLGLMYFAYRGINVLVLAPVMALLACSFHADAPLLASYTQVFMPALGGYLLQYFPVFLLGSIFGKLMSDSGAAAVIGRFVACRLGAERGVLAVIVACAVLTYGGVSLFVVAFSVYPIAVELFRAGEIPKRLIPASIALGSFTFTMSGLPGTPAIQNAIPMPFFGTTAFAAPGLGMIGAIVMFGAGYLWLDGRARRMQRRGEGYGEPLGRFRDRRGHGRGSRRAVRGGFRQGRHPVGHGAGDQPVVVEVGAARDGPRLPGGGAIRGHQPRGGAGPVVADRRHPRRDPASPAAVPEPAPAPGRIDQRGHFRQHAAHLQYRLGGGLWRDDCSALVVRPHPGLAAGSGPRVPVDLRGRLPSTSSPASPARRRAA